MFCYKCGSELVEDACFCSKCGTKVVTVPAEKNNEAQPMKTSETSNVKVVEQSHNSNSNESLVKDLIIKYFSKKCANESNIYVFDSDSIRINNYLSIIKKNYTAQEPLVVFNYMNEGLNDGIVITDSTISYNFRGYAKEYRLKDIKCAKTDKVLLATVMYLSFFDGSVSGDMYLTGIKDEKGFVKALNDFLLELNQPEKYAELKANIENHDISTILSQACSGYVGESLYSYIGTPISSNYSKYYKAVENYGIEMPAEIYVIYDESVFGTCKKGFAICKNGFYYSQGSKRGFYSWEEMKNIHIKKGLSLEIGDLVFATSKKDSNAVFEILTNVKNVI